jgi:integrase
MADIPISWKKITHGLPKGKKYAYDRILTIEEIQKLVEYPDRRIKAIVCTMASSGIRIGT